MADLKDGRYGLEYGSHKAIVEFYTVNDQIFYDYSVDGKLLVKQATADQGENKAQLLERLQHIFRNSSSLD